MDSNRIVVGDSLDVMTSELGEFDAVITDPPYGMSFMGAEWDYGVPGALFWKGALVLTKPGGVLLAFGGTRTAHRLAVAIEDAGWKLRDCLMWVYGTGMRKSRSLLKPAWEPIIMAKAPGKPRPINGACGRDGRWPANLVFDEAAGELLDRQSGTLSTHGRGAGCINDFAGNRGIYSKFGRGELRPVESSSGGASRFFYCVKAGRKEREGNDHPTVKPIALMRWLCRLVVPVGGRVLDPFCGSGSTGVAAIVEGMAFVGIEREHRYAAIARKRIEKTERGRGSQTRDLPVARRRRAE